MEISSKSVAAYTQAIISFLLILCTFLPYITIKGTDYSVSLSYIASNLTVGDEIETKYKVFAYMFIIYFMLLVLNVFIQAIRSCRIFSCLLSLIGGTFIIVAHVFLDKMDERVFDHAHYGAGFYLIIVLLIALLFIPSFIVLLGNNIVANDVSEDDVEALKAKIKKLENE